MFISLIRMSDIAIATAESVDVLLRALAEQLLAVGQRYDLGVIGGSGLLLVAALEYLGVSGADLGA